VANLQVKNFPDDLHERLRRRAAAEGTSVSQLVVTLLRAKMVLPSMDEWLAELHEGATRHDDLDVLGALDAGRDEIEGP